MTELNILFLLIRSYWNSWKMNGVLIFVAMFLLAAARPESRPELPQDPRTVSILFLQTSINHPSKFLITVAISKQRVCPMPRPSERLVSFNEINVNFSIHRWPIRPGLGAAPKIRAPATSWRSGGPSGPGSATPSAKTRTNTGSLRTHRTSIGLARK